MITSAKTQRNSCRPSGSVLIMAIFIAAFLFFLSVALVAQNRQNILLVLSEDNRIRASNCANAGLDLALHVMRNNPQWPNLLPNQKGEFASGGTWQIESIKEVPNMPHILEIKARGTCSFFASAKTRYVEEIPFADAKTVSSFGASTQPTHIFAYAKNTDDSIILAALTPDMRWQLLGAALPGQPWLVANEGPLFSQGRSRSYTFTIQDIGSDGKLSDITLSSLSKSVVVLQAGNENFSWSNAKYPCSGNIDQKNSSKQAKNSAYLNSGSESLTKYLEATTSGLDFHGPTLEWYVAEGKALAADRKKVYCHGTHYYYQGTQARLTSKGYQITQKAEQYTAPCLLCYNASSDSWSVVMDQMKVTSRSKKPAIKESKQNTTPSTDTLAYNQGKLYCLAYHNNKNILCASSSSWSHSSNGSGLTKGIYSYQNQLLYHKSERLGSTRYCLGLNKTNIISDLYCERPAIKLKSENQTYEVKPKFCLYPRINSNDLGNSNDLAVCGKHIYTLVRFSYEMDMPSNSLDNAYPELYKYIKAQRTALSVGTKKPIIGLVHYDGKSWQLMPNGLSDLAANWGNNYGELAEIYDKYSGTRAYLQYSSLAAAKYEGLSCTKLNRYATVLDKDDN